MSVCVSAAPVCKGCEGVAWWVDECECVSMCESMRVAWRERECARVAWECMSTQECEGV